MRIVPIKEALAYGAGETVPSVRGRITDVSKQIAGGQGEKAWKFQKLTIKDDSGEIVAKIWDRDPIPHTVKGQTAVLSCKEGDKGLTGIKAKEDDYRGVKSTILNITSTGIIDIGGGSAAAASETAPAAQSSPAATQHANPAAPASNGNGSVNLSGEAKEIARGYYRVMSAAHEMRLAWDKGHPDFKMTPEHFQAACASLFIHCDKRGMI
jgi:hypothetical protein